MVINGILQSHVRPLDGAILENNCMLASTNTHLVMGFEIPQGFTVWIGNPRDIAVLDGALLNCYVMFKLVEGWTHMKVVKFYSVRKNGKFDYQTKHVGTVYVQDIFSTQESMDMVLMHHYQLGVYCAHFHRYSFHFKVPNYCSAQKKIFHPVKTILAPLVYPSSKPKLLNLAD